MKFNSFTAVLSSGLLTAGAVSGALSVTSENFSPNGSDFAGGFYHGVTGWGESSNTANFTDFVVTGGSAFDSAPDFTRTAGLANAGYLYRELGTRDTFSALQIAGDNFWRDNPQEQRDDLTVAVFSLPAANPFTFAESGNDIATALGVNPVGSFTSSPPTARDTVAPFSFDFDVSALAADDRLFVRLSDGNPGAGNIAYVDNLTFTLIPEPSSSAFLALGLLGLAARRR